MTIQGQIQRLRGLRKWSREDIALITGLSMKQIMEVEEGNPVLRDMELVADALGMKVWMIPSECFR